MAQDNIYPVGMRRFYIYEMTATTPTYATGVRIPCKTVTPNFDASEIMLEGEDTILRSTSNLDSITLTLGTLAGVELPVYGKVFGAIVTDSSIAANEMSYMDVKVSNQRPAFGTIMNSWGDEDGVFQMATFNAKVVGLPNGTFDKGAYHAPSMTLKCLPAPDDDDTLARLINWQVASDAAISTTWATNHVSNI